MQNGKRNLDFFGMVFLVAGWAETVNIWLAREVTLSAELIHNFEQAKKPRGETLSSPCGMESHLPPDVSMAGR